MVLRSVSGADGGAEKIILRRASRVDRTKFQLTIYAIHRTGDNDFDLVERGKKVGRLKWSPSRSAHGSIHLFGNRFSAM